MSNPRKAMSDKDKKLLWGKAAGRCSICKKIVINTEDEDKEGVIVGVESHIVGHSVDGPRGQHDMPLDERHHYKNMILLCSEHAKTIDERTDIWTVEKLRQLKQSHEEEMLELRSASNKINPKIKLIEPTGKSTGGPQGHFHKFSVRNFGKGEVINLKCWIRGWGISAKLSDPRNRSFIDEKETIEYDLRVDGTPLHNQEVPFLNLHATYRNLDDQSILYSAKLRQDLTQGGELYDTKIAGEEKYQLLDGLISFDRMEILPSRGDYTEAMYSVGGQNFKVKVSRSLLACWDIPDENIWDCFYDLGLANVQIMSKLNAYQDKEYSTMTFPKTEKVGLARYQEAIELIETGQY